MANQLARIIPTIGNIARPKREAPEAKARLEAFARDHGKRETQHELAGERLRSERDEAIRAAYRDGVPMRSIAKVMKIAHQRISQIVRG